MRRPESRTAAWYGACVSGTYTVSMGDRGRLVVPVELRERLGLVSGTPVLLIDTADGLVLATRDQAKRLVREQLQGASLVSALLTERRSTAAGEE